MGNPAANERAPVLSVPYWNIQYSLFHTYQLRELLKYISGAYCGKKQGYESLLLSHQCAPTSQVNVTLVLKTGH